MNKKKIAESLDEGLLAFLIQGLILFYMVSLSLETVPSLQSHANIFTTIDTIITGIFAVELIVRLMVTEKPLKYLISFYGFVDMASILPALFGANTKSLRVLRLLRLFKLLKNKEISAAVNRMQLAFNQIKKDLVVFSFIALIFVYFSAVGIYHFEQEAQPDVFSSIPAAFWWAIVTLTTVGYGDSYPITTGGKIFSGIIVIIGIGIVAIPTGLIASALTATKKQENDPIE